MANLYLYVVGAMMMMTIVNHKREVSLWFGAVLSALWPISFPVLLILGTLAGKNKNG